MLPGQHPSIGQGLNVGDVQRAPFGHGLDKLTMSVVHDRLQQLPVLFTHHAKRRPHVLIPSALDDEILYADFVHELFKIGQLHNHANTARECSGIGQDTVGGYCDIIPAGRRHRPHGGHDCFLLFRPHPFDCIVNLLRGRNPASRRIDPQDNGLDEWIMAIRFQLIHGGSRIQNGAFDPDERDALLADRGELR